MRDFEDALRQELAAIQGHGLLRQLRRIESPQSTRIFSEGREFLNFSSNDYLGLANHPIVRQAAVEAIGRHGAGAGASRLICGSLAPHHELEEALAAFKGTEAALSFSSGYAAALGTIGALLGKDDIIVIDRLVHACVIDAARLSGATVRVFGHNDLEDLDRVLRRAAARRAGTPTAASAKPRRILIVTESVFSMDGDLAPLDGIVGLKEQHGAWLMLDEAHATGLYGVNRRGLADARGLGGRIEIQMGTLGKALGASGGFICGSRRLIDVLINRSRSFIFSTASVPAASAAASAALALVQSGIGEERCRLLWDRIAQFGALGRSILAQGLAQPGSPIIPVLVGDEGAAMAVANRLRDREIFIPAIRYPAVRRGEARLRVTLTADHTAEDVAKAVALLTETLGGYAASGLSSRHS